jgi:hypothetical protein
MALQECNSDLRNSTETQVQHMQQKFEVWLATHEIKVYIYFLLSFTVLLRVFNSFMTDAYSSLLQTSHVVLYSYLCSWLVLMYLPQKLSFPMFYT